MACSAGGAAGIGASSMTTGPGRSAGAVAFRQLSTAAAIAACMSTTIPALIVQYRRFSWFVVANAVMAGHLLQRHQRPLKWPAMRKRLVNSPYGPILSARK
jgi:hypothetical protein